MTAQAYPLHWPLGRPRTKYPERSRFDVSPAAARDELIVAVDRLGGNGLVLSTDIPLRNDGLPHARYQGRDPDDRGVAIYFTYKGKQMAFACDKWDLVRDNMRAIAKTIEALRGIARWGTGEMVQQAFDGFAALPPPATGKRAWHEVLGVDKSAGRDVVVFAHKNLRKFTHPDAPKGDAEKFKEIEQAWKDYENSQ